MATAGGVLVGVGGAFLLASSLWFTTTLYGDNRDGGRLLSLFFGMLITAPAGGIMSLIGAPLLMSGAANADRQSDPAVAGGAAMVALGAAALSVGSTLAVGSLGEKEFLYPGIASSVLGGLTLIGGTVLYAWGNEPAGVVAPRDGARSAAPDIEIGPGGLGARWRW